MAKSVDTSPNPIVTQLLGGGDPPLDVGVLIGYFGPSKKDNQVRLYTSLDFHTYYEFPIAGVLSTIPLDPKDSNSPTRVFLKGGTFVDFVRIETTEARYLCGQIADRNLARATAKAAVCAPQGIFAASVDGPCCNTVGHHCTNANTNCPIS
jgi:hypothetical protein